MTAMSGQIAATDTETGQALPQGPDVKLGCVANVFCRMMHFTQAGQKEFGHTHDFDHLTLLARGSVNVEVEGVSTVFHAPHMIWVHKDKRHEITALEADTVAYCIHALRGKDRTDDDIIPPDAIPDGVVPWTVARPVVNTTTTE